MKINTEESSDKIFILLLGMMGAFTLYCATLAIQGIRSNNDYSLVMYIPLFFIWVAILIAVIRKKEPKIQQIELYGNSVVIKGKTKEEKYKTDICKDDIIKFQMIITNKTTPNSRYLDILTELKITLKNNEELVFEHKGSDTSFIKKIFTIAKYLPNFEYKVNETDSVFTANIENIAQKGKNMTLKEHICKYLQAKDIPNIRKATIKCTFEILCINQIQGAFFLTLLFIWIV